MYAQDVLLPWEDAQAFDKLHEQIRGDLKPSGYLQEQTVREITVEYWRKQRLAVAYALPFYKKQMTPELKEAGKGGIASLATYLADRSTAAICSSAPRNCWRVSRMAGSAKARPCLPRTRPRGQDIQKESHHLGHRRKGLRSQPFRKAVKDRNDDRQSNQESHGEIGRTENLRRNV